MAKRQDIPKTTSGAEEAKNIHDPTNTCAVSDIIWLWREAEHGRPLFGRPLCNKAPDRRPGVGYPEVPGLPTTAVLMVTAPQWLPQSVWPCRATHGMNDNGSLQQWFVSLGNNIDGKLRHT
jgi:hypothetical protein